MTPSQKVGASMKMLREKAELSQKQASALAQCHQRTVADIESGETNPNLKTLAKLAAAYQSDLAEVFSVFAETKAAPDLDIWYRKLKTLLSGPKAALAAQMIDALYRNRNQK